MGEPGRSTSDISDLSVEPIHGYRQWVYDLRGMEFNEALAERTTPLWCGSWGYGRANFVEQVSMGVSFDQNFYHYFNGQVSHAIRKHRWALRKQGGTITCSSCWMPANGQLYVGNVVGVGVVVVTVVVVVVMCAGVSGVVCGCWDMLLLV